MNWFSIFKSKPRGPQLTELLGDYPPYGALLSTKGKKPTLEEAQAGFDQLMAAKSERLAALGSLLSNFGLYLDEALGEADPRSFLLQLHEWTKAQWPAVREPVALAQARWLYAGPRDNATAAMVWDTGLLFGEMIIRRKSDFSWRLNLDPEDKVMNFIVDLGSFVIKVRIVNGRLRLIHSPGQVALYTTVLVQPMIPTGPGEGVIECIGEQISPPIAVGPANRSKTYSNAYDQFDAVREEGGTADDAASHIGVFVAWALAQGLADKALKTRAAAKIKALSARQLTPSRFLYEAMDGKFTSDDLNETGRRFADAYYGRGGTQPPWRSYLDDLETLRPSFTAKAFVPDGWASYDAIAPTLDRRFAEWRAAGEP